MHGRLKLAFLLVATVLAAGCTHESGLFGGIGNQLTKPGDAATDLIRGSPYSKLVVEVHAVPGHEPRDYAIEELKSAIAENTAKGTPTVRTTADLPAKGESHRYTWAEIEALEKQVRKGYASGDAMTLHILYLDGHSEDDGERSKVLGAAYRGTSLVMFKGTIERNSASDGSLIATRPTARCVERAVLIHELGHALGLVNHGIPMVTNHEDPDHPGHSNSKSSVMYWAVESTEIFSLFGSCSGVPYQFDANDKADMKAVREG